MGLCVSSEMAPESPHTGVAVSTYRALIQISIIILLIYVITFCATIQLITVHIVMEVLFKVTLVVATIETMELYITPWISNGAVTITALEIYITVIVTARGVMLLL